MCILVGYWIAVDPYPPAPYVSSSFEALDNAFHWVKHENRCFTLPLSLILRSLLVFRLVDGNNMEKPRLRAATLKYTKIISDYKST